MWTSTGFGGEPGVLVVLVLCVSSVSGTGAWAKTRWGKSQKKVVDFLKKEAEKLRASLFTANFHIPSTYSPFLLLEDVGTYVFLGMMAKSI